MGLGEHRKVLPCDISSIQNENRSNDNILALLLVGLALRSCLTRHWGGDRWGWGEQIRSLEDLAYFMSSASRSAHTNHQAATGAAHCGLRAVGSTPTPGDPVNE